MQQLELMNINKHYVNSKYKINTLKKQIHVTVPQYHQTRKEFQFNM